MRRCETGMGCPSLGEATAKDTCRARQAHQGWAWRPPRGKPALTLLWPGTHCLQPRLTAPHPALDGSAKHRDTRTMDERPIVVDNGTGVSGWAGAAQYWPGMLTRATAPRLAVCQGGLRRLQLSRACLSLHCRPAHPSSRGARRSSGRDQGHHGGDRGSPVQKLPAGDAADGARRRTGFQ